MEPIHGMMERILYGYRIEISWGKKIQFCTRFSLKCLRVEWMRGLQNDFHQDKDMSGSGDFLY